MINPWPNTQSIANAAITSNEHYNDDDADDDDQCRYQWLLI